MLRLLNTETKEKERIVPFDGMKIRLYTCGPTIYNFAHIGNFRTYVFEDLLRRTLLYFGMQVEQAMNLTDVDDKTIGGALIKGISLKEFTEPYRVAFFEDLATLNIQQVEHYPAATDYIPEMIRLIQVLIEQDYAYRSIDGSIYFSIAKFPKYGRLSHLNFDALKVNASGDNRADEYDKDNACDFVLWKSYEPARDGEIYWESPFGRGRPGWHIECSAMAMKILGETIDIHCGGVDNMFPHHENEIAQSECCSGKQFVRHWLHAEHLLVDHKKMSKSLGNFYTLRDLLKKGYTGAELRYLLISTHYRTQLNFTFSGLDAARASLQRIGDFLQRLSEIQHSGPASIQPLLTQAELQFKDALGDDLNISVSLSVLFELIREVNRLIDEQKLTKADAEAAFFLFRIWDQILGLIPFPEAELQNASLLLLLEQRNEARRCKDWKRSDEIRDQILAEGYLIEDTPNGARLKRK